MTRLQQLIDAIPDEPQWESPEPYTQENYYRAQEVDLRLRLARRDAIIRAYHEALSYSVRHPTTLLVGTEELLARFEKEFGS